MFAAHQLFFNRDGCFVTTIHCAIQFPPLRSERDRDALREAAADGIIDAICF